MTETDRDRRLAYLRIVARWVPAVLLICAAVALYASGLATLSFDSVKANEIRLRDEVAAAPINSTAGTHRTTMRRRARRRSLSVSVIRPAPSSARASPEERAITA